MRILLVSAVLAATVSCASPPPAPMAAGPQPTPLMAPAPMPPAPPPPPAMAAVPVPPPGSPSQPMVATVYGPPNGKFEPILPFSLAPWAAQRPMRLTLSNIAYDSARVQAVVTPLPDCAVPDGVVPVEFDLPLNSTRIIEAPPGMDVCWRRAMQPQTAQVLPGMPRLAGTGWTPWNREFLSTGRSIDVRI